MFKVATALMGGLAAALTGPAAASTLIGTGVGSTWFPGAVNINLPGQGTYDVSVSSSRELEFVLNEFYMNYRWYCAVSPPGPPNTCFDYNENSFAIPFFATGTTHTFTFVVPGPKTTPYVAYGYEYLGVPNGSPAYRVDEYRDASIMVEGFLVADDPVSFSVTVTRRDDPPPPQAPAPEPATWALMMLGLGTTGTWLRRARRRAFA